MATQQRLKVRVSDELTLDAGTCEAISEQNGAQRIIRRAVTARFHQVLASLTSTPCLRIPRVIHLPLASDGALACRLSTWSGRTDKDEESVRVLVGPPPSSESQKLRELGRRDCRSRATTTSSQPYGRWPLGVRMSVSAVSDKERTATAGSDRLAGRIASWDATAHGSVGSMIVMTSSPWSPGPATSRNVASDGCTLSVTH